ncbi:MULTISPECIES: long-chain fatty acid--CoA ligase [Streptomyces]|uniref:Long-chain fatty acid--CoA ligase n=1 Tax=Streptomyces edwardsiae TaxID=3075527 RepID=A0ABU2PN80_9ACTN|nr:long-chain fatty acid--CoA ligase [Streptomyces sp. DSM 41636]MDT0393623.1 long-chain fatty acid--CoA ligase [Streptomyces sp. DSM 41636]
MTNLAALLDSTTARHPDRTAVVCGDSRFSYSRLDQASNQVAQLLVADGVGPGDKVALSCPNLPYFPIVYFGILKAGATVVPLNVLLKPGEIAYHLDDSDAVAYFAFEGTADLPIGAWARQAYEESDRCRSLFLLPAGTAQAPWAGRPATFETVDVADDDTAVILYTSGTTGRPKGAELRHRNMRDNVLAGKEIFAVDEARPDTYLCVLPLFHSFGQTVVQNGAVAFGGTLVMQPRFDAEAALTLMLAETVTFFAGVPTMYWGLLGAPDDGVDVAASAANLRVAVSGGSALPGEVHRDFRSRFGVTVLEGYGLSETSPVASFSVYGEQPRVGSIGVPIPGVDMKLIGEDWSDVPDRPDAIGEIAIRGHNVMKGYYGRPEATAEAIRDGWFRSGDIARKDADGFYYIVDRAKDMILRGGFNVYPREIEELLMTHPAVSLVAVLGVPNDSHGEEIKAVVVKKKDHDDVSEADIVAWAKERLAAYKYPRIVEFRDFLPLTATGKILKREI